MTAPGLKPERGPNIIFLQRVSGDKQDVLRQQADMEKLKRKYGANIVRVLSLQGVSGTDTLDDEQVQQVLADLADPNVDGIGLSGLDRLFRPAKRYGQWRILDYFVDAQKKIWSALASEGEIDPKEDYDKCMAAGTRAGAEWRLIRQRSNDQKRALAEMGIIPHGNAKFGWDIIGRKQTGRLREGRAVLNATEAPIARELFIRRRAGMSSYNLAAWLNELGVRNKVGCHGKDAIAWSEKTVIQLLKSTDYIGQHFWQGIMIPIPPIIDEETFYEVQALMEESRKAHVGRRSTNPILLRTFLWCALCGHRCQAHRSGACRDGSRRRSYRCWNVTNKPPKQRLCPAGQVDAEAIENTSFSSVWRLLKDPDLLLQMGREHYSAQAKPHVDITQEMEQRMAHLKQRDRNLERMLKEARNDAEFEGYQKERYGIRNEINTIESRLRSIGRVITLPPLDVLKTAIERITSGPEPKTYEERRPILESLVDLRMEYGEGELTITGKVPIPDSAILAGNWKCGLDGTSNSRRDSWQAIPFILKRRVA